MNAHGKTFEVPEKMSAIAAQGVEQARVAMNNYLQFLEKNVSALPSAEADQAKKWLQDAENNIAAAFDFAEKLTNVKSIQEIARVQTAFVTKQMQTFGEQAKKLEATATKLREDALGRPDC